MFFVFLVLSVLQSDAGIVRDDEEIGRHLRIETLPQEGIRQLRSQDVRLRPDGTPELGLVRVRRDGEAEPPPVQSRDQFHEVTRRLGQVTIQLREKMRRMLSLGLGRIFCRQP